MRTNHPARGASALASILFFSTLGIAACGDDGGDDDGADTSNDDDGSSSNPTNGDDATNDDAASSDDAADDASTGSSSGADDAPTDDSGSDTASCADEGAGPPADALEIEGDWVDDFMGTHAITAESWTQTSEFGTLVYAVASWDNAADTLVAQDEADSTWSKFQWAAAKDGTFYYCQTAFGEACRADAEAAPAADATDPAVGGCGGMFPWTHLTPPPE